MNSKQINMNYTGRKNRLLLLVFLLLSSTAPAFAQAEEVIDDVMGLGAPILIFIIVFVLIGWLFVSRYRRCPSDKVLVIYGKTGKGSANCIHGGAAFVWPVIQDYAYMDLSPINIDIDLKGALSKQNIRVDVPSRFTIAISNEEGVMQVAAERLLGKSIKDIRELAQDIIFGQLRLVVAMMDIEEINADRDKFLQAVMENVESELRKIGLHLINVNVTDIHDEGGYIEALGKKANAFAINEARVEVAVEEQKGSIGEANANRDKRIQVSQAISKAEIGEADADAAGIRGKNLATIDIANSNSDRREKVSEANKRAEIAEETNLAEAQKAAYLAQKLAEEARAERELATKRAEEIVRARIAKEMTIIEAEAEAEKSRTIAQGEADAILKKYEAEAEGIKKVLQAKGLGFEKLVNSSHGDTKAAIGLLLVDILPEIAKIQTDAIQNLKFDKITVFDGGDGNGTSSFINSLYKSIPALQDFLNQSGMNLPEYLAKTKDEDEDKAKVEVKDEDE